MEEIYLKTAPNLQNSFTFVTRSQVMDGTDPEEHMLLQRSSHKIVGQKLMAPELSTEVDRAVNQVEESLRRQKALEEERTKLHQSTKRESSQKKE